MPKMNNFFFFYFIRTCTFLPLLESLHLLLPEDFFSTQVSTLFLQCRMSTLLPPVPCREGSSSEVPILVVGNKRDLQRQRFMPRRAVSVLVKKTWKCGYVECSAKFNWHVVLLFKELLGIAVARGMRQNHTSIRLQGALQRNRCSIM